MSINRTPESIKAEVESVYRAAMTQPDVDFARAEAKRHEKVKAIAQHVMAHIQVNEEITKRAAEEQSKIKNPVKLPIQAEEPPIQDAAGALIHNAIVNEVNKEIPRLGEKDN